MTDTATQPLVSVIIPCYNTEEYLPETLDSVLAQTHTKLQIIAVDDGSTDGTPAVLERYAAADPRLHIITQENSYCVRARINAIARAKGKYLVCLDSDDKIAPDYIRECVSIAEQNLHTDIVYSDAEFFGTRYGIWPLAEFSLPEFLMENSIYITALIRKSAYDKAGGFDPNLTFFEDWDLFISMIKNGSGVHKIGKTMFFYRKRENETSVNNLSSGETVSDNAFKIYQKHYGFYKANGLSYLRLLYTAADAHKKQKKENLKRRGRIQYLLNKWFGKR